jgi:hypothetical protein
MDKQKIKLQLSKGYYLKFDHLSKVLDYLSRNSYSPQFSQSEMAVSLGMSLPMVVHLTSYGVALELLIKRSNKLTELGILINKQDMFFDNEKTLWLLHYIVASNEKYVVWNRMINQVGLKESKISTEVAKKYFEDLKEHFSESSVKKHLSKEINVCLNAYTEQKFNRLEFFNKLSGSTYKINNNLEIPDLCVLAACYLFRDRYFNGATGIEIAHLAEAANSPGRVFHISEAKFRMSIENLHKDKLISIESRANLDQIRFNPNEQWLDIVKRFYE